MPRLFTCAHCLGTFETETPDEAAQAEAERLWGKRGDAPGMSIICGQCFDRFMAWLAAHPEERP
jgi:hypothetical protein